MKPIKTQPFPYQSQLPMPICHAMPCPLHPIFVFISPSWQGIRLLHSQPFNRSLLVDGFPVDRVGSPPAHLDFTTFALRDALHADRLRDSGVFAVDFD
jgi:hypothetical protein